MVTLANSPLRNKSLTPVSRDDLLQSAKAVHDENKSFIADEITGIKSLVADQLDTFRDGVSGDINGVKALVETRFKDLEQDALMRLGKTIDSHVQKTLDVCYVKHTELLNQQYAERMEAMQKSHQEFMGRVQSLEGIMEKRLEVLEKSYIDKANFIQQSVDASMQRLELLLTNLQIPPATVMNTVEGPIVNVPQQLPAEVVVNVPTPEVKNIVNVQEKDVTVNVPPPRLTEKRFTYDDIGRPETITEKEM